MRGLSRAVLITLTVLAGAAGTAFAQQSVPNGNPSLALAQVDPDEADRQTLRNFLGREEVQRVARMSGVDLSDAEEGVLALEGEMLSDAAGQVRAIERELGSAQGEIRLSATVIIIILLLLIIIIVAA